MKQAFPGCSVVRSPQAAGKAVIGQTISAIDSLMRFKDKSIEDCARGGVNLNDRVVIGDGVKIAVGIVGDAVTSPKFLDQRGRGLGCEVVADDFTGAVNADQHRLSARLDLEITSPGQTAGQRCVYFRGGIPQINSASGRYCVDQLALRVQGHVVRLPANFIEGG